jgi:ABC-2 type transport system permease protein
MFSTFALLKPYIFACKNRVKEECKRKILNREVLAFGISGILLVLIYRGTFEMISQMEQQPAFTIQAASTMLHICLIGFFLLLLFASCIAALNFLFSAKDLPLLLSAPIKTGDFLISRGLLIGGNAGWMFFLFGIPALLGFGAALELPLSFYVISLLVFIPFVAIPVLLSVLLVVVLINIVPPHRLRDFFVIAAFFAIGGILYFTPANEAYISTDAEKVADLLQYLHGHTPPGPLWLPTHLAHQIIDHAMTSRWSLLILPAAALAGMAFSLYALTYTVFARYYLRGWSISIQGGPATRVYDSPIRRKVGRLIFFWDSQLGALASKEWRLFVRDTTQSLQLLLLLTLTFVYLFNFRALREGTQLSDETFAWWHVVLSLANIAFGTCVVSAIATRFVFPSVSLEGRAFCLLRNAPISIERLLVLKFRIWIVPITVLSMILLVSGTWAIQAPIAAIVATAILAVSMSIGIVGLGIGIGAVYAKFDWESPAQVTASFGSLVFMLLSLGTIFISLIPGLFIFVLTCVPSFRILLTQQHYLFALGISYFLIFATNWIVAKRAMSAGAQRLREMEK